MTPARAQKQQDYSYKYSNTVEGKEASGDGFGAAAADTVRRYAEGSYTGATVTEAHTVYCTTSIISNITPRQHPPTSSRGGKSMTYSITEFEFRPYSYLLDGQKVNSVLGACFAGKTLPVLRTLLTVSGLVASGIACAGSAEGAAVVITAREWWALGIGFGSCLVLCWLYLVVSLVLDALLYVLNGKPPGVINVTPPDEWELEPKEEEFEPALLVEQPVQPCTCLFCSPGRQGLLCPNRSASKAGAQ